MKYLTLIFLGIFLAVPAFSYAETVVRIGSDSAVSADQTVNGDYYASSGFVGDTTMSGKVTEDMYVFGAQVTVNGTVEKDLTIVGGVANIHGTVQDDLRILGGEVTIAEHVGGDVFVIGGSLKVLSTATIDGDVIFFGGTAEINGTVAGSILGNSEVIRIDAEVGKNVDVKTKAGLTLGEKANIKGFVTYSSQKALVRAQNATVVGEVTQHDYQQVHFDAKSQAKEALIPLFISLFATLSLYLFFRKELQVLVTQIQKSLVRSSLSGLIVCVLGPIAAVLLMVTVVGLLVGFVVLALVCVLYVLGLSLVGAVFGAYLSKWFTNHPVVNPLWLSLGTIAIHALLLIPAIGPLCVFGLFTATVGGVVLMVHKRF